MTNSRISWLVFIFFGIFYFLLSPKVILGSNDGSHFLLARSIAAGQLKITPERMPYTGYVSFAEYKGDKYSDRPPGLALLATPAYLAAKGLAHTHSFQLNPPEAETLLGGEKINSEDFFPLRSFGISLVHLIPILIVSLLLTVAVVLYSVIILRLRFKFEKRLIKNLGLEDLVKEEQAKMEMVIVQPNFNNAPIPLPNHSMLANKSNITSGFPIDNNRIGQNALEISNVTIDDNPHQINEKFQG